MLGARFVGAAMVEILGLDVYLRPSGQPLHVDLRQ